MKKMIVCAVIAGLFTGVASAKELTKSQEDDVIAGSLVGVSLIGLGGAAYKAKIGYDEDKIKIRPPAVNDEDQDFKMYVKSQKIKNNNIFEAKINRYQIKMKQLIEEANEIEKQKSILEASKRELIKGGFKNKKALGEVNDQITDLNLKYYNIDEHYNRLYDYLDEKNISLTEKEIPTLKQELNINIDEIASSENQIRTFDKKYPEFKNKFNQKKSVLMEEEIANGDSEVSLNQGYNPNDLKTANTELSKGTTEGVIGNTGKITTENKTVEEANVTNEVKEEDSDLAQQLEDVPKDD